MFALSQDALKNISCNLLKAMEQDTVKNYYRFTFPPRNPFEQTIIDSKWVFCAESRDKANLILVIINNIYNNEFSLEYDDENYPEEFKYLADNDDSSLATELLRRPLDELKFGLWCDKYIEEAEADDLCITASIALEIYADEDVDINYKDIIKKILQHITPNTSDNIHIISQDERWSINDLDNLTLYLNAGLYYVCGSKKYARLLFCIFAQLESEYGQFIYFEYFRVSRVCYLLMHNNVENIDELIKILLSGDLSPYSKQNIICVNSIPSLPGHKPVEITPQWLLNNYC